jgi:signal transduction histidine kinase
MRIHRAILIYSLTIVAPCLVVMWLGMRSFERQSQALATLEAEKLSQETEKALQVAAEAALSHPPHPAAKYYFAMQQGAVTMPALHAAPPTAEPAEFLEAESIESSHPDLALAAYQKLFAAHHNESLALSRLARVLTELGRHAEAKAAWRRLAASYPNQRDLFHRPYGIVAAVNAGDTDGLYDQIASGRWELAADQAEYFLSLLDPKRTSPYLDQFRFARELNDQFKPEGVLRPGEVYSYSFEHHRIFYRSPGGNRITGFLMDTAWLDIALRPQVAARLNLTDATQRDLRVYGGAFALVLLILSAGVALLWRDLSRETRLNRLRAELVSSVSHELKTPITLIRLYGETLLRGIDEQNREEFYRIIMRESVRLGRLVEGILRFSRVERGEQVYNFEEGDPAPVVGRVVDDYREYLERSGFHLERELPESAPLVRFDAAALSQAVVNLLDNAVKYSGDSRDIAIRMAAQNGNVTLEVEDYGIGIPATDREKIFERFYRVANGSGKGGYGVGLFLVRDIMDAHGGRAEVESELGRGSRFRLVFPAVSV